jgi:hypothetical protein
VQQQQEFSINSRNGWKTALDRFRCGRATAAAAAAGETQQPTPAARRGWGAELNEITEVIASCADDMKAIWEDPMLRSALAKRNVRLEETPGLCVSTWRSGLLLYYYYYCSFVDVLRADPLAPCTAS